MVGVSGAMYNVALGSSGMQRTYAFPYVSSWNVAIGIEALNGVGGAGEHNIAMWIKALGNVRHNVNNVIWIGYQTAYMVGNTGNDNVAIW
jgi:hypothetical protein